MQQAGMKVSNDGAKLVTGEEPFFGPIDRPEQCYYSVRAGIPVVDALEHARCLAGAVQRSLVELATLCHDSDSGDGLTSTLWSLSYVLEVSNAAIYAAAQPHRGRMD